MAENNPPLIGVVPLVDESRDSYWMLPGYFEGSWRRVECPSCFR